MRIERDQRRAAGAREAAAIAGLILLLPGVATPERANPFRIIAHRGASAYAPENTMPAFEKALALGAREVELDVQQTRDGAVILFHDEELAPKTGGQGRVRDHDLAALRELEVGTWFDGAHPEVEARFAGTGLITLAELFGRFGSKLFYHIEIKSDEPELPAKVLALVEASALGSHVMITSFRKEQLVRTRGLDAKVPISLLVGGEGTLRRDEESGEDRASASLATLQRRWIALARDARFDQVGFPSVEMSEALVRYARRERLEIRAYRIKSREDMEHAVSIGANGMTINWPDWLIDGDTRRATP